MSDSPFFTRRSATTAQPAAPPDPTQAPATAGRANFPIEIDDAPTKRARIDPSVGTHKSTQSPLAVAEEFIESHTSSLHEGIATLLTSHGREHLVLSQRLFTKERAKTRIEKDEDYIPVSARVNFRLQVASETEELQEYTELQNRAEEIVKRHQKELKTCCIESMILDIKAIQAAKNKSFCRSLHAVTTLFHIAQQVDVTHVHHTVAALLDQHSNALLKHTGLPTNEFQSLYATTLNAPTLVPTDQVNPPSTARIGEIKRALESVFVLSWDKYLSTHRENQLGLSLKKEAKATLQSEKTEAAAMEIDVEIPADRAQLSELIRKEATKIAQSLIKQEVSNQLRSKNGNGGQNKSSAPQKKKTTHKGNSKNGNQTAPTTPAKNSNSRTRQRANQRGRKADASNKDTQTGKQKKGGNRSKSRSTKRRPSSDSRSKRS